MVDFEKENSSFIVENDNGTAIFPFKQKYCDDWETYELKSFDIDFFYNPTFNREEDFFEVYLDKNSARDGYIFPYTLFESEEDYSEGNEILPSYIFMAFKYILSKKMDTITEKTKIADLVDNPDNCFVLILNHYRMPSIDISLYDLDLLSYGYSRDKDLVNVIDGHDSKAYELKKKLYLHKSTYKYDEDGFIEKLLAGKLIKSVAPELRFFLMYQIIEYLMRNEAKKEWEKIKILINNTTEFNFIKEAVRETNNERKLIGKVFESYHKNEKTFLGFEQAYNSSQLFNFFSETDPAGIFYNFRNKFIHNYEDLMSNTEYLNDLCFYGELIVFEIIKEKYKCGGVGKS